MLTSILVVEDDAEIREILAEMLSDGGYAVATASNGRVALDALRSGPPPAVILLDLMMPVMDGWQLRAEMLADPALANIPVIVVSGAGDLESSTSNLKASRILTKPVKWPTILSAVRTLVG